MDRSGRVIESFGMELARTGLSRFSMAICYGRRRAAGSCTFRAGTALKSRSAYSAQAPPILPVRVSNNEPALAQAAGAALLPQNEVVIQREVADWRRPVTRVVEIYNARLRRVGIVASDGRDLAGSAADGDLFFFTRLDPRMLQVSRMPLIKRLSL